MFVGDERALQERRSDSVLTSSLALAWLRRRQQWCGLDFGGAAEDDVALEDGETIDDFKDDRPSPEDPSADIGCASGALLSPEWKGEQTQQQGYSASHAESFPEGHCNVWNRPES